MSATRTYMDASWRLRAALAGAVFALCYFSAVQALVGHWSSSAVYSFGFAVPLISTYLVWTAAPRLLELLPDHDYLLGVPTVILGLGLLIVGHLGTLITIQQTSMVVVLAGLVLVFCGRRVAKQAWFPLAYLLLMVPIWNRPITMLQEPSQRLSAALATRMLRLTGIPAMHEGTFIALPNVTLEVLQECSGVNQLITIVAMALPAAYLFLSGAARRIALVILAVGVAYLSNGLRIALVGWLAYNGLGDGRVESLHLLEGLAVSVVGYLVLGGCMSLLARGQRDEAYRGVEHRSSATPRRWIEAALLVLVLAVGGYRALFSPADVRLAEGLDRLPATIDGWVVDPHDERIGRFPALEDDLLQNYPTESGERRFEGIDDELIRSYRSPNGDRVRLYIGYLRSQKEGKELSGEAGNALDRVSSPVDLTLDSGDIALGHVQLRGKGGLELLYWFDLNGRIVSDIYRAKALTLWDALTRGRTNGAVVLVGWECKDPPTCEPARVSALGFVRALVPVLRGHLPA